MSSVRVPSLHSGMAVHLHGLVFTPSGLSKSRRSMASDRPDHPPRCGGATDTITDMASAMRVGIASFGPGEFATLHDTCVEAGHLPVVYVFCRSKKPKSSADPQAATAAGRIVGALPAGMDLLIPGTAGGLAELLAGYRLDLLMVYGFSWRLPPEVLHSPRYGVINVHTSLLPKYRGPAPVLWAIRNGDTEIGMTIHRMDENFDTGPILAQKGGVRLDEDVTPPRLWPRIQPVLRDLLAQSLGLVAAGEPGVPQDEAGASYAGSMEPGFSVVDWSWTARQVHNQVRVFRFMGFGFGPIAHVGGRWLKVQRTQLLPGEGIRAECADGPLWIVESEPAQPPVSEPQSPR
jgi:methionyl-tRNA formyltransferase